MRHKNAPAARNLQTPDTSRGSAPALHIRIGRLTLEGYSVAEQKRFTNSLQSSLKELARHSGHDSWRNHNGLKVDRVDAGQLPGGATPEAAARHVATRVFAQFTPRPRSTKLGRLPAGEEHV